MDIKYFIYNRDQLRSKLQTMSKTKHVSYLLALLDISTVELIDAMVNTYLEKHVGFAPFETIIRVPEAFIKFDTHDEFWQTMTDISKTCC